MKKKNISKNMKTIQIKNQIFNFVNLFIDLKFLK